MNVVVDQSRCQKHGQCVFVAPAVFDLDDAEQLRYDAHPSDEHRAAVEAATFGCPEQAITMEDRG